MHEQAVTSKFCQRSSKLTPEVFFDLLLYCASRNENSSLSFSCSYLSDTFGLSISKQSLDGRFNPGCVEFVRSVLRTVLEDKLQSIYPVDFLSPFHQVLIKDSTKFIIPQTMSSDFRGSGGNESVSKAGISIQFEYDLKSGRIIDLNVTEAVRNDQKDASETASTFQKSDLIIRDLGYYSLDVLQKIQLKEAFFLSRLNVSTSVFNSLGEKISFERYYHRMKKHGVTQLEEQVLIGEKERFPVRMVLSLVSDEVYEKRIRNRQRKNKEKGHQLSREAQIRYRFNIFITNVSSNVLKMEQIYPCYKLRWQIELIFKCWKSIFKIHQLHQMKQERYLCLLYARLLLIVIHLQLIYQIQKLVCFCKQGRLNVLSINKCLKTLSSMFDSLYGIIRGKVGQAKKLLSKIHKRLAENHWLEKRKLRMNFTDIIMLFI